MNGSETSDLVDQLLPALVAAQAAFRPAAKGSENPHFRSRYADLSDVWDACAGPLQANGFAVTYPIYTTDAGVIHLSVVLWHTSGQWMRSTLPILGDLRKPQEVGSCITYYRRYLLAALLAIPTVDDDGEAATGRGKDQRDARPQRGQQRPDAGRQEVNRQFPARNGNGAPANGDGASASATPSRGDWGAYIRDRMDQARKHWASEMAIANVPTADRWRAEFQLPNVHQVTHHLVSHALEVKAIQPDAVEKDGKPGVRDPIKAKAAMATIYGKAPKGVRAAVDDYLAEKEAELRVALGMDDLDPADESQDAETAATGREPGSDDER